MVTAKEDFTRVRELTRAIGYLDGENCAGLGTVESNCIAVEPCEVLCVPLEVYEAHLKFDSKFNQLLLQELAYKLRTCTISSRVNALSPAGVRLAAYLCTVESPSHLNQYIKTNSLEDVASLIGTTKRHLNRILKEWTEKGIIKREEKEIQILNWDKINEISENVRFEWLSTREIYKTF